MAEDRTVCGSKSTRLAQLLSIGIEASQTEDLRSKQQRKSDLLCDLLATKMPLGDPPAKEASSQQSPGFPHTITSVLSESLESYLLQEDTSIAILERIKAHSAQLSRTSSSPIEQEPANVLYYAAIAGALVYHNRRITEFSLKELHTSLGMLSELPWLPVSLKRLFERGMDLCNALISRRRDKDEA